MVGKANYDFTGESAIVTGATKGIGRGIAADVAASTTCRWWRNDGVPTETTSRSSAASIDSWAAYRRSGGISHASPNVRSFSSSTVEQRPTDGSGSVGIPQSVVASSNPFM